MSIEQKNLSNPRINEIEQFTPDIQKVIRDTAKRYYIYDEDCSVYLNKAVHRKGDDIYHDDEYQSYTRYFEFIDKKNGISTYNFVQYDIDFNITDEGVLSTSTYNDNYLMIQGFFISTSGESPRESFYQNGLCTGQYYSTYPDRSIVVDWYYSGVCIPRHMIIEYIQEVLLVNLCGFPRELAHMIWELLDSSFP